MILEKNRSLMLGQLEPMWGEIQQSAQGKIEPTIRKLRNLGKIRKPQKTGVSSFSNLPMFGSIGHSVGSIRSHLS